MTIQEERNALLRSGLLREGLEPDALLWGVISGGRLEGREGILFLAGAWWGFYGRDFVYLTPYAGFVGQLARFQRLEGPIPTHDWMDAYQLTGEIEGEGELGFVFVPNANLYSRRLQEVEEFFAQLRQRVTNQIHPDISGILRQGLAHAEAGHLKEAEQLLRQAARLDERSALPPFHLGILLLSQKDRIREARQHLLTARERGYEDTAALHLMLGQAAFQEGDLRSAEREAQSLLGEGEDAQAHLLLASINQRRGQHREQFRHLKQAASLDPRGEGIAWLAYHAAAFGDWTLAQNTLTKMAREVSRHPVSLLARALHTAHQGDQKEARRLAQEALREAPHLQEALDLLARWEEKAPLSEPTKAPPSSPTPPPHASNPNASTPRAPLSSEQLNPEALLWLQQQEDTLHQEALPTLTTRFHAFLQKIAREDAALIAPALLSSTLTNELEESQDRLRKKLTQEMLELLAEGRRILLQQWLSLQQAAWSWDLFQQTLYLPKRPDTPHLLTGDIHALRYLQHLFTQTEIRLEALFSQLLHYALGILESGFATLLLLDLQSFEDTPDAEQIGSLLLQRLQPLAQRLRLFLKAWAQQHLALKESFFALALGWPLPQEETPLNAPNEHSFAPTESPQERHFSDTTQSPETTEPSESPESFLNAPSEIDLPDPFDSSDLLDASTSIQAFSNSASFANSSFSSSKATEDQNASPLSLLSESEEPSMMTPSHDPFASTGASAFFSQGDPAKAEAMPEQEGLDKEGWGLQIGAEETPPSSFPAAPSEPPLPNKAEDPTAWAYAVYERALREHGHPPPPSKERFMRILDTKIKAWRQRTGYDPEMDIEIEHGRPQIKLR